MRAAGGREVEKTQMRQRLSRMLGAWLALLLLASAGGGARAEEAGFRLQINEYQLYFAGEVSAGVSWSTLEDTPQPDMVFYLQLREDILKPIFTMTLMQEQGDYAMTLTAPDGTPVPVSFVMAERPPGLTEDEKYAFIWAQADVYVLMETLMIEQIGASPGTEEPFRIETAAFEATCSPRWKSLLYTVYEEDGSIRFLTGIGDRQYLLFTLVYNSSDGDYVITRKTPAGDSVNISFHMAAAPQELTGEERQTFYQAQAAVNEVAANLILK